jgi:large subunit ribosomal protein L13
VDTLSYKTISANKATAQKEWVVVDATDLVLGRMGSKVAKLLRGKYKPSFTPHVDCGDNVIIINAKKYSSPVTNGPTEFIFVTPDIPAVSAK